MKAQDRPESNAGFWKLVITIARFDPGRSITVVGLLMLSGLAEGVGLLTLLPLLGVATGTPADDPLSNLITSLLESLGLRPALGTLLIVVVVGLTLKAGLFLLAMRQMGNAAADMATRLRLDLISALTDARWGYFVSQPLGRFINAVGTEGTRATHLYTELCYLVAGTFQVVIYLTLALFVSWYVTAGALLFGGLLFFGLNAFVKTARSAGARETDLYQSMTARLADGLSAIKPLKAMHRESILGPIIRRDIEGLNDAWRRQVVSKAALTATQEPLMVVFLGIGLFVALGRTGVQFEELLFMALIFQRIVTRLGNAQVFYQSVRSLETAFWALVAAIERAQGEAEITTGKETPHLDRSIAFDSVSFTYGGAPIIDKLSFEIPAKTFTTIVGPSGVGKTTIVDLVVGLFVPQEGRILIDGVELSEIDIHGWRTMIGYVPQELVLLHDSILHNITLGDPSIGRAEVFDALEKAGALEFLTELPEGVDTVVGERGARLSGGQRQRLSIARALVRKPTLLVLDEATSALDPRTASGIAESLRALRSQLTILAISHQQDLVEHADKILTITPRGAIADQI